MFVLLSAATPSRLLDRLPAGRARLARAARRGDRAGARAARRTRPVHERRRDGRRPNEDADAAAPRQVGLGRSRSRAISTGRSTRAAARRRGRWAARCARLGLGFDRVLASPAARVIETLDGLAQGYGGAVAPDFDERIYLASAETLLELVRARRRRGRAAAARRPQSRAGAARLAARPRAARCAIRSRPNIRPARSPRSASRRRTGASRAQATGTLARFIRPRDLDRASAPDG